MTSFRALGTLFALGATLVPTVGAASDPRFLESRAVASLPIEVTNNAVTTVVTGGTEFIVSFAGLSAGKKYSNTLDSTFVFNSAERRWTLADPLPGGVGRLAATAATVDKLAYVFGGYSVAADGSEKSTPWVHTFDPLTLRFEERASIPVPVDDSLSVAYADRYIYLISGWHDDDNVDLVQRYDTQTDTWQQATPTIGNPVFGHAGGIVDNRIVYCDGVAVDAFAGRKRRFVTNEECFIGIIDGTNGLAIDWRKIESHPGLPRYRMAAAGIRARDLVLFVGGSENPYNYSGIGYNGEPSTPASGAFLLDLDSLAWRDLPQDNAATMDHRGLVPLGDEWVTIGGMVSGQRVTARVNAYSLED